jgi:hypothetical protein
VSRPVVLGLVAACALVVVAPAPATIAIDRGIAGVNLGVSQAVVRAKLGRPRTVVHGKNEFGSYAEYRYGGYVVVFQNNGTVTSVVTTLARERTAGGIGVGSDWSQVLARVPRVICEGVPRLGDCHVGELLPGKKVTDFFVRGGKVDRVVVAIVLD